MKVKEIDSPDPKKNDQKTGYSRFDSHIDGKGGHDKHETNRREGEAKKRRYRAQRSKNGEYASKCGGVKKIMRGTYVRQSVSQAVLFKHSSRRACGNERKTTFDSATITGNRRGPVRARNP